MRMVANESDLTTEAQVRCGRSDGMFFALGNAHEWLPVYVSVALPAGGHSAMSGKL